MKYIYTLVIALLVSVATAHAATTAVLSPGNINTQPGKTFTVSITLNPGNTATYTDKVEITYPADILEVSSFTYAQNWMALTQTGYDSTDNTKGILIKTAGYPGGMTAPTLFGTITFKAKKAGIAHISVGGTAYEANTQNKISGSSASVTVAAPVLTSVPQEKVIALNTTTNVSVTATTSTSTVEVIAVATTTETIQESQQALAVDSIPENTKSTYLYILGGIALLLIGFFAGRKMA